ncbi:MAG TPA: efflux RND transporter periplasmic adaptor subunit [Ktedonobacteraceae bacterium]|nr:efflux RND transporter periplasmic adaptor subunit [Ktedonobacteraceae bacterium]
MAEQPVKGKCRGRERLIAAALGLVEQRYFDDITIDDIIKEAHLSRPAFYYHFGGGKEELRAELVHRGAISDTQTQDTQQTIVEAAGTLSSLSVKLGDTVTSGETIGSVTPATGAATGVTPASINLTSPINGTILQVPAVQGQGVAPGLTLLTITNLSALTVTATIDENAINNIQVGQAVDIHIDAYSDTSFTGHVQQIVQAAASEFSLLPTQDNASGNFTKVGQRIPVVITLDGTGGKDVVPGMSAEVTIHLH